jgi:hypothetical protein
MEVGVRRRRFEMGTILRKTVRQISWVQFATAVQALAGAELPKEWNDPAAIRDKGSFLRLNAVLNNQVTKTGRVKKLSRGLYEVTFYERVTSRDSPADRPSRTE